MQSFQVLGGYLSSAKEKITSTAQSIWKSDYVQATWQGLTAPIYSYTTLKSMIVSSEDVETSISRAFKLNAEYVFEAFVSYFVFYNMAQPAMNKWYADQDPDSWAGATIQTGVATANMILYGMMNIYLVRLWLQNTVENFAITSSITYTAGKAMRPSEDFKPCGCSGGVQVTQSNAESLVYYAGNRYLVTKLSYCITNGVAGVTKRTALAFGLEAISFGLPLVEYKFSAAGRCTEHRYKDILSSYKTYCFMYGASFVAATWSSYKILAAISGEENPYIYDAVFTFMFQFYALLAISRDKKFPGNDHVTIDFVGWFKYFLETRPAQYALEKFLGNLYSIEKFVQSPGVGLLLSVRDNEIKGGISSIKKGIQQVRDIQSSRIVSTVRWVSNLLPYNVVPEELKNVFKTFSKTAISKLIRKTERYLEMARTKEIQRNAQFMQATIIDIEDHFSMPAAPGVIAKIQQPMHHAEKQKQIVTLAAPVPVVKPAAQNLDTVLQSAKIVVDSDYFIQDKVRKPEKTSLHNSSTLFAKKDGDFFSKSHQNMLRKQDSLASVTASIISGVGNSRALK